MHRTAALSRAMMFAALLVGGCSTTTVTYRAPWLREVHSKEATWDSGGRVSTIVERRDANGWSVLPHARAAVALAGGRAAVRTDGDRVFIVSESGSPEDVPSCAGRNAVLSPDQRRLVCYERGLWAVGFVGDVLVAVGDTEGDTPNDRRCRLVAIDAQGRTTTKERAVHYPPDDCNLRVWSDSVDEAKLGETPVPGP